MNRNKKIIPLLAATGFLIMGSLSMFSDFVTRTETMATGNFAIGLENYATDGDVEYDLMPGWEKDLSDAIVKNVGSTQADIKVVLTITTDSVPMNPTTGTLSDDIFSLNKGTDAPVYNGSISAMAFDVDGETDLTLEEIFGEEVSVKILETLGNEAQTRSGSLKIEIFGRQGNIDNTDTTTWPQVAELLITDEFGN